MRRETTKQRIDKLINEDCEEMNEATRAAAIAEFSRVAHEYFETDDVAFNMKKLKNGTDVSVTFRATRIKNFTLIK